MRFARRWSWVAVLVIGLALFYAVRRATLDTGNPNLIPSLILLGAAVVPMTFVAFLAGRRIDYGVSGGTLALTALVGGVIGVVTAGVLEYDALHDLGVLPMVAVGLIEESAKLIAPLVLVFALRPRRPADGLLIGVASGAGFATLETMGYAFVTLIQSKGSISAVDDVLFLRGVLSPAAHMAWTGLTAAALWYAAEHRWHASAVLRFVGIFVVAVALHTAWDSLGSTVAYAVLAAVSLGLLGVTTHRLSVESRSAFGHTHALAEA
ncbi:PrsW family intramembrane metalloprotease [Cryptosporangium sp. NPDC048952]|uniref:PrsW family intramembrane metalloprotease n=1 Tax=Cryptosporangium sp. NPDC048952 TaxID=3363961 RepID=UPI00371D6510